MGRFVRINIAVLPDDRVSPATRECALPLAEGIAQFGIYLSGCRFDSHLKAAEYTIDVSADPMTQRIVVPQETPPWVRRRRVACGIGAAAFTAVGLAVAHAYVTMPPSTAAGRAVVGTGVAVWAALAAGFWREFYRVCGEGVR